MNKDYFFVNLVRDTVTSINVLGKLYLGDEYFCETLENTPRPYKIPGQTCIPCGVYPLILTRSNRFQRILPELKNVANYSGVRLHGGNTDKDTEGCPLVAYNRINEYTIQGTAINELVQKLSAIKKPIFISVNYKVNLEVIS